jgi:hypothetical protein
MVIALEKSLHRASFQHLRVLAHLVRIIVFPVSIRVFCIEVIFIRRNESWRDFFILKGLPIVIFEPWMLFYFSRTVKAKSVDWLSLDQLIYKVSCLKTPAWGDFVFPDLDLLWENMVSDFFSIFTNIGPLFT